MERLRWTGAIFLVAVTVHGVDHLRRGTDVVSAQVVAAGTFQYVAAVVAVVLVFRGHRWAPIVAAYVGFSSAVGFAGAHLLPHWSSFSDSYVHPVAPGVTFFSWVTALLEIAADAAFGDAALLAIRHSRALDRILTRA